MKSACFKFIQFGAMALMGLSTVACDNAVFDSSGGSNKVAAQDTTNVAAALPDYVFLQDSFERDDIFADLVNNIIYGWRGFVLDGANAVIGFQSNGAGASIPAAGALGPAQDGERFLLLNGRTNGTPVETVQVITPSYDLTNYNTVVVAFRYMTFGLNDADDTTPETLRLEVCRGTLNECGANDDVLDPAGLQSNNWVTVFESDPNFNDSAFDGMNHTVNDWRTGLAIIDLNDPNLIGSSSTFVMRFVGVMRDGYTVAAGSNSDGQDGKTCECTKNSKHTKDEDKRDPATSSVSRYEDGKKKSADEKEKHHPREKSCKNKSHHHPHKKGCHHKKRHCKCKDEGNNGGGGADGTLLDGIAIDNVRGYATQLLPNEIF